MDARGIRGILVPFSKICVKYSVGTGPVFRIKFRAFASILVSSVYVALSDFVTVDVISNLKYNLRVGRFSSLIHLYSIVSVSGHLCYNLIKITISFLVVLLLRKCTHDISNTGKIIR